MNNNIMAVASLMAAAACHVHAAPLAQSNGSVTGLAYQVRDLTPDDQYTAGFTLSNGSMNLRVSTDKGGYGQSGAGNSILDNWSGSVSLPVGTNATASAVKAGNSLSSATEVTRRDMDSLDIQFFNSFKDYYPAVGSGASVSEQSFWDLAPHTEVTLTGRVQLSTQVDASSLADHPLLLDDSRRSIKVRTTNFFSISLGDLYVYTPELGYYESYGGTDALDENYSRAGFVLQAGELVAKAGVLDIGPKADAVDQTFSITVRNNTDQQMKASLNFSLNVSTNLVGNIANAPVVPEPGTWALMGLGLSLMAWRVRALRH